MQSSPEEKIRLFRAMFCGREDVFAERWESKAGKTGYQPVCANHWIRGVCPKCAAFGRRGAKKVPISCAECPVRQFEPISDRVIANHLRGSNERGKPFTVGVYPLLADDTVRFAAIDFDKASWRAEVHSVIETLRDVGLPVACERSRSGNGAHLWFFFEEPEAAGHVRDVLSFVLTLTMERNPSMGLDSYDRIFPNQSRMPKGGRVEDDEEPGSSARNYYFQFTLNDYDAEKIKPRIPPIEERLETFKRLAKRLGRDRVVWRFDPLFGVPDRWEPGDYRKDKGQREACGCIMSKDIGEYNTCPHLCRYCYANANDTSALENWKRHCACPRAETITGKRRRGGG